MSRFNTGNPLGSNDPRDLDDNAKNMDLAANADEPQWVDRFGRDRKSFFGMETEFDSSQNSREARFNNFIVSSGYQFLADYGPGIEFTEYNQLVRDENGEFWRLSGQVELPYTTTGDGIPEDDALVPAGDAVLRQDLANPDKGAAMVARGVVAVDSIADLLALPEGQRREDLRYIVKGYHALPVSNADYVGLIGGGLFRWSGSAPKDLHDGGCKIDPDRPFPEDWSDQDAVLDWFTASVGAGMFLREASAGQRLYTVGNYGAFGDGSFESTLQINRAIGSTPRTITTGIEPGSYLSRGIDLSAPGGGLEGLENREEYTKVKIETFGDPLLFTSANESVFVLLNSNFNDANRGNVLSNVSLEESSDSLRRFGVYGARALWANLHDYQTVGFEVGTLFSYSWNSRIDKYSAYHFREIGFSIYDPSVAGVAYTINGLEIGAIHCSSNKEPFANFDFRLGARSISIASMITEGSCQNHILVSTGSESLNITSIHKEGTGSFIAFDSELASPSVPFCNISIASGAMYDCGAPGERFIRKIGVRPSVGISTIDLGPLYIQKVSTAVSDYFDMSHVARFSTLATFRVDLSPSINNLTWHNVGEGLAGTIGRYLSGHDGVPGGIVSKGVYTGVPGEVISWRSRTGAALLDPQVILEGLSPDKEETIEVDVDLSYNVGEFINRRFFSRFLILKTMSNQLIIEPILTHDSYAGDTVFTLSSDGATLMAQNTYGFGTYHFRLLKRGVLRG